MSGEGGSNVFRLVVPHRAPERTDPGVTSGVGCSRCEAWGTFGPLQDSDAERRWTAWVEDPSAPAPVWALLTWRARGLVGVWRERVDLWAGLSRRPPRWDCGRHARAPGVSP
jgi:hypothetical protein